MRETDSVEYDKKMDNHNYYNSADNDANSDENEVEDINYKISELPGFNETRALFVANLPLFPCVDTFKNILIDEAKTEDCTIERAWLSTTQSHCYVICSGTPGAVAIRQKLNGHALIEESRRQIFVDFVPVRAVERWIEQEQDGPPDAIWKISYTEKPSKQNVGSLFKVASHEMLNYPNTSSGYVGLDRKRRLQRHSAPSSQIKSSKYVPEVSKLYTRRSRNVNRGRGREKDGLGYKNSKIPFATRIRTSDTYIPDYRNRR